MKQVFIYALLSATIFFLPACKSTKTSSNSSIENVKNHQLTAADNGKSIDVGLNETITATFKGCRGCASTWQIVEMDKTKLSLVSETNSNPSCKDCVGGSHDTNFNLKTITKGKSTIKFKYFEEIVTFSINVR